MRRKVGFSKSTAANLFLELFEERNAARCNPVLDPKVTREIWFTGTCDTKTYRIRSFECRKYLLLGTLAAVGFEKMTVRQAEGDFHSCHWSTAACAISSNDYSSAASPSTFWLGEVVWFKFHWTDLY